MNHAITVGGLIATSGALGGVLLFAFGVVLYFAGAMSDVPGGGDSMGKQGCGISLAGIVLFALGLHALFA